MGKKGDFNYSYNGQISVDADRQIIVAQHLSLNANDKQEVEPALSALQDSTGRLLDQFSADNGYFSGGNLQALEQQSVDAYLAPGKGETTQLSPLGACERKLVKADFSYHETPTPVPADKPSAWFGVTPKGRKSIKARQRSAPNAHTSNAAASPKKAKRVR